MPVPTLARQMFFPESATLQPVTCRAPLMDGCAPGAACQVTVCRLVAESAAVRVSGAPGRYTPSASCTAMSVDMDPVIVRTCAWALDSEQGCATEHSVPVPDTDAYSVVVAA